MLHALPHGYGEGDLNAIADGTNPPARDTLRTAEQATGQHQSRSLVHRQPVSLHELHPAKDGTVGRVDLMYLHSLPVAAGNEVGLDLAVKDALRLGAISFDAVKHLLLCRIEGRPPRLDLDLYPYLPRVSVQTTRATDYMSLLSGRVA